MLKKRIIPCLDIKNGRVVKGVNFEKLRDAGNAVELASVYADQGADELVFLDITATLENRKTLVGLVREVARAIDIPFTVGGGISSIPDAEILLEAGADKVSVNSSAIGNPDLVAELASKFGNQAIVVAIDTKPVNDIWRVFSRGGSFATNLETIDWAKTVEKLGAGEILLTSMANDGAKQGFAIDITKAVCEHTNLPVIASGGAGKMDDFVDVFSRTNATGALAASIFHFGEIAIPELKTYLKTKKIPMR
ncbi:imidazole glycerol phosphate synthase subunit HisF [Flavobacterium sp.]|uniref:imidazole glycerol phosphate synthase subunit HisF n=1 Tax=Flavobacterium sp. TaxID=239 RepID=UPI0012171DEB|nr:imidazole glycerol phosphate synthase subunit HisF [Flavobacterium sp.]RZJ69516.1 MAG: imidazole glycerol phosphate synthase subunit HisF [Flavobacterium sp.]